MSEGERHVAVNLKIDDQQIRGMDCAGALRERHSHTAQKGSLLLRSSLFCGKCGAGSCITPDTAPLARLSFHAPNIRPSFYGSTIGRHSPAAASERGTLLTGKS
jgi:hypothetical protein